MVNEVSSQTEGFLIYLGFSLLGKQAMSYYQCFEFQTQAGLGLQVYSTSQVALQR